jgi:hypothetical protein
LRVVLSTSEVSQIIVDHLVAEGKIEAKEANVIWDISQFGPESSSIVVEQP